MSHSIDTPESHYDARIRFSFERQQVMQILDARLVNVIPGEVHIEMPYSPTITQQHGYVHAGIITTILDSACGYAAYSQMPSDRSVLSVEFKVNFLHPAQGENFLGIGKVIKSGRTLTVCSGEMHALYQGESKLVAIMQATMIAVTRYM